MYIEKKSDKKYLYTTILILFVSIGGVIYGIKALANDTQGFSIPGLSSRNESSTPTKKRPEVLGTALAEMPWWNTDYSYFMQVSVTNATSDSTLSKSNWVKLDFNHEKLVDTKKSQANGNDLRLVYLTGSKYNPIHFELSNVDTQKTRIEFQLARDVQPNTIDNSYFLYYGNLQIYSNDFLSYSAEGASKTYASNYQIITSEEVHPKIFGRINRHWILKGETEDELFKPLYSVELEESLKPDSQPSYEILGTETYGKMRKIGTGKYQAEVDVKNLLPGTYEIQAIVKSDAKEYKSQKSQIHLSFPLYVTMTLDWEGYDVEDYQLAKIIYFAQKHDSLSITQFFNPRIFVTSEVSTDRADFLKQWILSRQIAGDEIGLHLHMHYDLVEAAGVAPKTGPTWNNYINNGHDVPCSVYSTEEFKKILNWSKQQFIQNGLTIPTSFRAGGWFLDLENLQALENTGFKIDSSGREAYNWGNNGLRGYWTLNSTTSPYQPSKSDQNAAFPSPTFSIWEFPNNGANSRFYTSEDLIRRFEDNLGNGFLEQPQVVTYLSHPQGFHLDENILDITFYHIDRYLASEDSGPVIYVTLEEAYDYITTQ